MEETKRHGPKYSKFGSMGEDMLIKAHGRLKVLKMSHPPQRIRSSQNVNFHVNGKGGEGGGGQQENAHCRMLAASYGKTQSAYMNVDMCVGVMGGPTMEGSKF